MKIAFVVNSIETEWADYTTTHLALAASRLGHECWYVSVADLCYGDDERVHASARRAASSRHLSVCAYLRDVQGAGALTEDLDLCRVDVIMLRNDPAEDAIHRPWARLAGMNFGRLAAQSGVLVLNDPHGLFLAVNKLFLQQFPATARPRAIICRDIERLQQFREEMGGTVVAKPLHGSGGRNVFLLRPEDAPNVNQIVATIAREGYILVQEYIPEAIHGDTRLFVLNGQPLEERGVYAAIHRVRSGGDMRSNLTAGATSKPAQVTDEMIALVDTVRPHLLESGMFLVGLDIAGNKLMEINVFSPGGLGSAESYTGIKFSRQIIRDIERKLIVRDTHGGCMSNAELAVL